MLTTEQRSFTSIRREAYFGALKALGLLMEGPRLNRVNRAVGWGLVHLFLPRLEGVVRARFGLGPEFHLKSRHSVRSSSDYNIFFSDLDLNVILSESELSKAAEICLFLLKLKRALPFLGEVEVYSSSEREEMKALLMRVGELHKFLRDVRKLTWVENDDRRFKTPYHRLKFERAVKKILSKMKIETDIRVHYNVGSCASMIEARLNELVLPRDVPDLRFQVFSRYLNFGVKQGEGDAHLAANVVSLASPLGLWLLALTPFEAETGELRSAIKTLRHHEFVRETWTSLLRLEAITMGGVYRADPDHFTWIPEWKSQLESWLPKSD